MSSVRARAVEVRRALVESETPAGTASIAAAYRELVGPVAPARFMTELRLVEAELLGAGPLQTLLDDESVSDVLVFGGGQVWVDRGSGLDRLEVDFGVGSDGRCETAVRELAVRLVASSGRRLDEAQPFADAVLRSGHRVHAAIPPIARDGTCLSIRTLRPQRFDLAALERSGTLHPIIAQWIKELLVQGISIVLSGETGSGKTTLLAAMLSALDPARRIVVLEDTAELRPRHPHIVRLQSRPPNVEGAGEISLRNLVRQALRMRPDRIVIGEVRGHEVVEFLLALNTGHRGGLCTIHANGTADVPARFEALGLLAELSRDAVHALLAGALQVVLHLRRDCGVRTVAEIGVLHTGDRGFVEGVVALRIESGEAVRGPGYPELERYIGRGERTG